MKKVPSGLRGVLAVREDLARVKQAFSVLLEQEVLVGFPEDTQDRFEELTQEKTDITNAAIAYIQDNGAPEANIPARPFMLPGLEAVEEKVALLLLRAAKAAVVDPGGALAVERFYHQAGIAASTSIKNRINEGIPPPLSEWTLRDRIRRGREGAMWELAWRQAGAPAGTELAKPLVDTGQLRNAVTYVIRRRKQRRK